ncbi:DNA polymerase III subunit epsilon [Porphyrobacter sp. CACIAM 03H1]|uniref:DNA polymerase III subunit epsilon n=1 Tax=Porphyrobacter sp. CACIAM 03H1 TaxID=2003315 RepID=UPI000B5A4A85|nr:DNA polymerase III subunit epsilon [Porphyrobacter sp. CACIAM 03H1]ASJ89842.1 DNA polymerase III subunit epsilon [Porphyrobacter sp. CACIAM 03H1]
MREVIFDTETTGLDPKTGDRMVEIGCIEMIDRVETGRTFHAYFNPDRDMPVEAERVHGLSAAFLATKPRFAELADELLEFLGDAPLVAHNAGFDFGFLNNELELAGRAAISMERMVDTVAIARRKHPGAKLSLDALCTRYGIDRSHRVKHGALLDAELLAQVYVELTGGRQIGLGLAPGDAVPTLVATSVTNVPWHRPSADRPRREPRPHVASPEELERHRAFIAGITDAIWAS